MKDEMPEKIWARRNEDEECLADIVASFEDGELRDAVEYTLTSVADSHADFLQQQIEVLKSQAEGLAGALGEISRMRTMPDHKTNTITLAAAHKLAEDALAAFGGGVGS